MTTVAPLPSSSEVFSPFQNPLLEFGPALRKNPFSYTPELCLAQQKSWSDNPSAPKIPLSVLRGEKTNFSELSSVWFSMVHAKDTPHTYKSAHPHSFRLSGAWFILGFFIVAFSKHMAAPNPVHCRGAHQTGTRIVH